MDNKGKHFFLMCNLSCTQYLGKTLSIDDVVERINNVNNGISYEPEINKC